MTHGDAGTRILALLNILTEKTDQDHPLSMPDLLAELSLRGFTIDRRTLYQAIRSLNRSSFRVSYTARSGRGYYLQHSFSPAEILLLCDALQETSALPRAATEDLITRLMNTLSSEQRRCIRLNPPAPGKTDNEQVIPIIELLLSAIAGRHPVEYVYYDMAIDRTRHYRRNRQKYRQVPYAVISGNGWYYGIFYSETHRDFAAYRIDKMAAVTVLEDIVEPVRFDLDSWMRSSFHMYKGNPETVTVRFDRSLSSALFDQFGHQVIVSAVNEDSFTASIRTAVTPTLTAWLLQYYDRITILRPASLITEMQRIASLLDEKYGRDSDGYGKTASTSEDH